MELDERKATILRAIVEEYVPTAQPVGSQTDRALARPRRVERHGAQRHDRARARGLPRAAAHVGRAGSPPTGATASSSTTSTASRALAPAQRRAVADFFTLSSGPPGARGPAPRDEPAAGPGEHATPRSSSARTSTSPRVRSVQLVSAAAVAACWRWRCCPTARSRSAVLHVAADADDATVATAGAAARHAALAAPGWRSLPDAASTVAGAGRRRARARRARRARRPRASTTSSSRSTSAARAGSRPSRRRSPPPTSAARLLELLEHQVEVVVARARPARPGRHRVGSAPRTRSTSCATARSCVAPYKVEGEVAGTVGVLGPTRMDYRQALAAVAAVSQQLGRRPVVAD